MEMVERKEPQAKEALLKEMSERPVVINRAPTLHRYSLIGGWAKLVPGDAIQLSPLVYKGMNADNDGDTVNAHAVVTANEIRDVIDKMMPSKNLFSVSTFKADSYIPQQEYAGGLYTGSARVDDHVRPITFASRKDAVAAYKRGEISAVQPVHIAGE
jgi:DNA-directed RNA polymerase subunit beta'